MAKFRPKILVVDDEPEARAGLARLLRRGYEVVEAASGEEALSRAKNDWPALIVLDILLPDIPGTEVLERLRKDPITRAIPVLLLTAKPHIAEKLPTAYGESDRTFEKPGRVEDLLGIIRDMLASPRQ